jgi:hypothetical protein
MANKRAAPSYAGEVEALLRERESLVQMTDALDRDERIKAVTARLRELGQLSEPETTEAEKPPETALPPKKS